MIPTGFPTYEIAVDDPDYEIVSDQEDLLYYDGPIVWTGRNRDGERILASDLRDFKNGREFAFITTDSLYEKYIAGKRSYLELMKIAAKICVKDWASNSERHWYRVPFTLLPKELLPTEESYLPL